ncbi:hypothetical protein [Levilactobacillus brevis]|uniref:hypothetical protein n=1 Tax=Levilactobacillus brevis TaxID=1580 RepID=UPI002072C228|nr:hypothetical protein [Levilactobacillus brevis]MCM6796411.1 hypothetical protein [Levilactobacillus brevis]
MIQVISPLISGLHGTGFLRVFHWIFRDNPAIGIILLAGIILYSIYRYMNRR